MQIHFESRTHEGAHLRGMAERRLRFAMRRLAWLVPRAHVRLSDDNGPRGGVDKRCHVELRTHSVGTVVITALARDWPSALENAIGRASRVLVRSLRRGRHERIRRRQLAPAFGFER